ncbi:class I SAM-dependent methyltransferase [Geotalea sp. SG265]|uniref:class I SAM-dependent DNA methyltransferase n=1 Tax=Geotalea sp. SG265 TaxID=2922867 RepID=UPI001FB00097|nr:class I SAM-dependent methyltransferase [Geotalea sp. SG265]
MSVFGTYSKYYNLCYRNKNYAAEASYIHEILAKHAPGTRTILDFGCGTGSHDFELAKLGYEVTGIDMSEEMLHIAVSRLQAFGRQQVRGGCTFLAGDIRTARLNSMFDVVVSLFHVMSYQTSNNDLKAAFVNAKANLKPGGLFIFDCWYGPAVLTDPPVVRVKRLEDDEISVIRIAEPAINYNDNVVDVNYDVLVTNKRSGVREQLSETHRMRYLFQPEIVMLLEETGFETILCEEFVTGKQAGPDTWGVVWVCKAVD